MVNHYFITIAPLYSQFTYELQGVLQMRGGRTDNTRHYVTFRKVNQKWMLFDDELIEKQCPVLGAATYMAFYAKGK